MALVAAMRAEIGLLIPEEVAKLLDVTDQTLALWRMEKRGPDYVKLGRNVFYRKSDVIQWIEGSVVRLSEAATA